jgi:hypothetical protein
MVRDGKKFTGPEQVLQQFIDTIHFYGWLCVN